MKKVIKRLIHPYLVTKLLWRKNINIFIKYAKGRIVDFGCFDFCLSKDFQPKANEFYGIDNWVASNCHRLAPEGARFYYANIEKSPFKDSSFDMVICTDVLEHVENPDALLSECYRVLKKNGKLILSIPFNFFLHGAPNDFRRYTIYGLERILKEKGFVLKEYCITGDIFYTILIHLITYFYFSYIKATNRIKRYICAIFHLCLNILGIIAVKYFSRGKVYKDTSPSINDRTHPVGYVLMAEKEKGEENEELTEEEILVCPDCHSKLNFLEDRIICNNCGKTYKYYEGIPVLAEKEMLHLEYEAINKKIDF